MATITEDRVRLRARQRTTYRSATAILNESVKDAPPTQVYDVFLSHSVHDAEIVLGVKLLLEDHGRTVYVDWIDDPLLDRSLVTPRTAETIRSRMRNSRSLIYVHTRNSSGSKWMPWELGYSDGLHGAVAILPVTAAPQSDFDGQEYLGIYPWVDEANNLGGLSEVRIHKSPGLYRNWRAWTSSPREFRKTT